MPTLQESLLLRKSCLSRIIRFHVGNRLKGHMSSVKKRLINVGALDARKQNDVTIRVLHRIVQIPKPISRSL